MESWIWGIGLIGVTIAIHSVALVWFVILLRKLRDYRDRLDHPRLGHPWMATLVMGAVGMALATLHAIEAGLWALAYLWVGAIGSLEAAMLYSIDSMTTRGDSGLRLDDEWLIMGALEAADGMLLFGISTAFLFGVISHVWSLMSDRKQPR